MADLTDAGNTWNPAMHCIYEMGFELRCTNIPAKEKSKIKMGVDELEFTASRKEENKTIEITASTPIAVLGLIVIWEKWGQSWSTADIPDWWSSLPDE